MFGSNPARAGQFERRNLGVTFRGDDDRIGTQAAVHEPRGVGIGHGIGDLDRHLDGPTHFHLLGRPSPRAAICPLENSKTR